MTEPKPDCSTPGRRTLHRQRTVGGPPWWVPVPMLLAAITAYVVGAALLVGAAPDLAQGIGYGPVQLGAMHLLGLAFLSVAIAGALMQLVPVLLRTRAAPPALGAVAGLGLMLGAWLLAIGLWQGVPVLTATGGTVAVLGGGVMAVSVLLAVQRAWRAGDLTPGGVGIGLAAMWFVVVLVLGMMMAENRAHPFITMDLMRLIEVHGVVAIGGWIGGAILALSLNLAPMFALAHGYRKGPGTLALGAWHSGVLLIALGLALDVAGLALAGTLLALIGLGLAVQFATGVLRHRRRRVEAPMAHLMLGLVSAGVALLVVPAAWLQGQVTPTVLVVALLLGLVGLGCGVTAGHLFKIVPMLVWTGRFAHLAGRPGAPKLSDLYPQRLALAEQATFGLGLVALVAGVAGHWTPLATTGAALVLASALIVMATAIATVTHRVPEGDRPRGGTDPASGTSRGVA